MPIFSFFVTNLLDFIIDTDLFFVRQESHLSLFVKLQKATISFVMSAHLAFRMEQLGSHWADFHELHI